MVDSFFSNPKKRKGKSKASNQKKRKTQRESQSYAQEHSQQDSQSDSEVPDVDENELEDFLGSSDSDPEPTDNEEEIELEEEAQESAADKRRRLAKQYLQDLKKSLGGGASEENEEDNDDYNFDAKDLDDEIISSRLKMDVAEQKGWIYKFLGEKLKLTNENIINKKITRVSQMALTSVAVHWPYAYTTSKDLTLTKWDIRDSSKNPKQIKSVKGGLDFEELKDEHAENGHFDEIYACVVSPDGKYVVTGGKDGRVIVWSTNSLSCIRVLETKNRKGEVLSMCFRRGSDQLYVSCADLKIRTYSINQLAQLETLYGHQDIVCDISALGLERCVSVGSRDRTAMLWKISEETRLTFRGGDSMERFEKLKQKGELNADNQFYFEGSIDCVSMIDDSHFVTGSDNGNVCLWSLAKKKPLFTKRVAHGIQPNFEPTSASAEKNESVALRQVPEPQPFWITSVYALPYSDIFITGSWDGKLRVWKIGTELRNFDLVDTIDANGIVTKIQAFDDEEKGELRIYAALSKEHRLGRWIKPLPGTRNALFSCIVKL